MTLSQEPREVDLLGIETEVARAHRAVVLSGRRLESVRGTGHEGARRTGRAGTEAHLYFADALREWADLLVRQEALRDELHAARTWAGPVPPPGADVLPALPVPTDLAAARAALREALHDYARARSRAPGELSAARAAWRRRLAQWQELLLEERSPAGRRPAAGPQPVAFPQDLFDTLEAGTAEEEASRER
ncbi:hypothetical protein [Motilibacter deserti]|uniref:Uncharacterized protein n=1 Tax=Motilibacter deserti TaxID=2714956 RepID=A0ABX0GSE4_9ACTN|nr:hypothetical protein [Motilibacter deserti]NHC13782.1 hypothetical protein [Motilibacter deserti]